MSILGRFVKCLNFCCCFYVKELIADPFQFIADAAKSDYVNLTKSKGPRFTRECCSLDADTYAKAG